MIEIILMLFGLAFSNNNTTATTANDNNLTPVIVQPQSGDTDLAGNTGESDTGGETGTTLPPKK